MALQLAASLRSRLRDHVAAAYPDEGCGFLIGTEAEQREVREVVAAPNRSAELRSRRFTIAPEDFLAADRRARARGLEVLGFFHSHPDHVARPSQADAEAAWPWYSYVIVAVTREGAHDITCWRKAGEGEALLPEPLLPDPTAVHPKG